MKAIIFAYVMLFSLQAKSGAFFEPSFSYMVSGKSSYTGSLSGSSTSTENEISGFSMSGKLGLSFSGFAFGGVGTRSKLETKDTSTNAKSYKWGTRLGFFAGYSLPIMLGVRVSYLLPLYL